MVEEAWILTISWCGQRCNVSNSCVVSTWSHANRSSMLLLLRHDSRRRTNTIIAGKQVVWSHRRLLHLTWRWSNSRVVRNHLGQNMGFFIVNEMASKKLCLFFGCTKEIGFKIRELGINFGFTVRNTYLFPYKHNPLTTNERQISKSTYYTFDSLFKRFTCFVFWMTRNWSFFYIAVSVLAP